MRKFVHYEMEDGIVQVTIDNPPVNALSEEMSKDLRQTFEELETLSSQETTPTFEVVILTAVSRRNVFVAGGDINLFLDLKTKEDGLKLARFYHSVINTIANFKKPVICAVNGHALGGGTEIALACDIRVVSATARFGLVETSVGIVPGGGGTQRLPRLIGAGMAKRMIFTAERIDADEAFRIGLVEKVVPQDEVLNGAKEVARAILRNGPHAVRAAKMAINKGLDTSLEQGLIFEQEAVGIASASGEVAMGAAAFLEKRKPDFRGKKQRNRVIHVT